MKSNFTSFNGNFSCSYNNLTSLKGAPSEVCGGFSCDGNNLTSLKGAPSKVGGYFNCNNNQLTSLEGAPSEVGGYFDCNNNQLTSLEGAPSEVGGYFSCSCNNLTSLEGAPSEVGGDFSCIGNNLTSLKDIHKILKKMAGTFYAIENPIKSHVLGLLLIPGCKKVRLDNKQVQNILNNHLPNTRGNRGLIECQSELLDANLDNYAEL